MTTKTNGLDVAAVADAIFAKGAATIPPIRDEEGNLHVLVPQGYELERIPAQDPKILRIQTSALFHDEGSFIAYVNRYKDPRTRICAETGRQSGTSTPYVEAIFDYHQPNDPQHAQHTAIFKPTYSEEWARWTRAGAMPTSLELGIPVFFKGARYSVPVFLRYRLADGKLTFTLKVDRGDYIEQAAFDDITTKVAKETETEIYMGRL